MTRTDAELLAAHLGGDPGAFGELFTRHQQRLWAVALRTTGNPEDAADALQDGLISAYEKAAGFRSDAQVSTWLHRIVVNAALDRLRRNKVRLATSITPEMDFESPAPGPAEVAVSGSVRDQVLAALDQLPPDQKAALILIDMEGFTMQEAAAILDAPAGTIKSRCSRGRAKLAEILRPVLTDATETGSGASNIHRVDPRLEGGAS
ncbi:MAG TPA: RNA polymerase sigma factor SigM [Marmoricola sp.]|nr:RNA polymerase sigma factor SigM [Marmoricola sp.]HNI70858.1 RNA polymerase sigma factor SigM [Marmoricola sp.]HNJ78178.1 RNA polymerase sigma factor SigM [Marmoricola sp.]HNO38817.1 RNA polymerase sigma factor SigM [Marmoricola sp.]